LSTFIIQFIIWLCRHLIWSTNIPVFIMLFLYTNYPPFWKYWKLICHRRSEAPSAVTSHLGPSLKLHPRFFLRLHQSRSPSLRSLERKRRPWDNPCQKWIWLVAGIQWNVAILQQLIFNRIFLYTTWRPFRSVRILFWCFRAVLYCYILILQRKCKETYT
jgi:hypothetical protein